MHTIRLMPKSECVLVFFLLSMHYAERLSRSVATAIYKKKKKQAHINVYFLLQPGTAAPTGNHDKTLLSRPK